MFSWHRLLAVPRARLLAESCLFPLGKKDPCCASGMGLCFGDERMKKTCALLACLILPPVAWTEA